MIKIKVLEATKYPDHRVIEITGHANASEVCNFVSAFTQMYAKVIVGMSKNGKRKDVIKLEQRDGFFLFDYDVAEIYKYDETLHEALDTLFFVMSITLSLAAKNYPTEIEIERGIK